MEIIRDAMAGSLESSDIHILVQPNDGILIEIDSIVIQQFGKQIKKIIIETLEMLGVSNIRILVKDRGALDCTIKARLETAIYRACRGEEHEKA